MDAAHCALSYTDGKRSNKFYKLFLLVNADGKSVVVRHYGKNGTAGDVIVKNFNSQKGGEVEYEKLFKEKSGKGYGVDTNNAKQITDQEDLRKLLGMAIWPKMPPSAMTHLVPDADVSGRKELNPPRFDENGNFLNPQGRTFTPQEIAEARAREEADRQKVLEAEAIEAQKEYQTNSRYARFG